MMAKPKTQLLQLFFILLGGIFLLFVVAPITGLLLSSSPVELFGAIKNPEIARSIRLSLTVAMLATLVSSLFVVPFSWILARNDFRMKGLLIGIIDLPIMIPHSAAGIALLGLINRDCFLGQIAEKIGIDFIDRPLGIALAMAFVSIPFLFHASYEAFNAVSTRYEKAAQNLGAPPFRVFYTISLPMAWRGILSGIIMMFARGMSEFGAVVIIAYHPMTAPVLIFEHFTAFGLHAAQLVSVLFVGISLVVFVILRLLSKHENHVRS